MSPRHLHRRKGLLAAALLVVPFALVGCDRDEEAPQVVEAIATVAELSGAATVVRNSASLALQKDAGLIGGDVVVTGPASTAVIRYRDGSELLVSENTRFTLQLQENRLTLKLENGTVVSRGAKGQPAAGAGTGGELKLFIETSYGAAEIAQGSELKFSLGGEGPSMQVLFGATTVLGADGKATAVVAGQTLNFALGEVSGPGVAAAEAQKAPALPLEVLLSAVRGTPMVRAPNGKFVPAKGSVDVEIGTAFVVPRGARAILASKGVQATLDGAAEGKLDSAEGTSDAEKLQVSVPKGNLDLRFAEGDRELVLALAKGRALSLKTTEGAVAALSQTKKGAVLSVRAGAVDLGFEGRTEKVTGGQLVEVTSAGMKVTPAPRPAFALAGGAKKALVYTDVVRTIGLAVPAGASDAKIEVSAKDDFKELLLAGKAYGDAVLVDPPRNGELHWRFTGADGAELERGSAKFEPDRGRSVLDENHPKAEVAETGMKATVYFQSALPTLNFAFQGREGARSYRVRVYRADDLKTPLAERVVDKTSCAFEAGKIGEGEYLWYAAPLDAGGNEMQGGRMNKLELVYDNNRRTLAISRPRPNERPAGKLIETRGVAPIGAKLYINGKSVPLDDKGRFSQSVPRADALVYRVVRANGSEAYWVRTLGRRK